MKYLIFAAVAMFVFSGTAFAEIVNVVRGSNVYATATGGGDAVAGGIYAQDATNLTNIVEEGSTVEAYATNGGLAVAGGIDVIGEDCTTCGPITNVVQGSYISAYADGECSTVVAGGVMAR